MALLRLVTALQTACITPIQTAIDAGGSNGTIKVYNGTMPATPATAITTQTRLATLTFSHACGSVASGVFTAAAITQDSSAAATGTATWARIFDSSGATVADIDVTSTGGGGLLQFNTTNIVAGGPVLCTSFVLNVG